MGEPVAGKFLLEILTKGMYSNPMHVYREYIQNSTDSIDKAVAGGVISSSEAAIHIEIDGAKQRIIIHDNGYGIPAEKTRGILLSIGDSDKNGMDERGFRGIGRLAGLAYRIYITTLFTFNFDVDVKTINHYKLLVNNIDDLYVGGIMASLMPEKIVEATGIDRFHILTGLFTDTSVVGDSNDINVDELPLDYDILEQIDYKYPAGDNYFTYTTRGCPNHCSFCAVPILEPHFHVTNSIVDQIRTIDEKYGPKQHLLLLDNNILNTADLKSLVDDLCKAGFGRGAKYVDPGAYNIVIMRYIYGL